MRYTCRYCSRIFLKCILFCAFILFIYTCKLSLETETCDLIVSDPGHIKRAHNFARDVVGSQCRPAYARTEMDRLFPNKYNLELSSFVHKNLNNSSLYEYGPPFGFHQYLNELEDLLNLMSEYDLPEGLKHKKCKHCIVLGSGGVLHGLELGQIIDQFDVVIRLNNAPVHGYENDVGNKTTIRMTYPEGAPLSEDEYFTDSLFVMVLFKHVDFLWLRAMLKNETLSAWNKLFFWKSVADNIPLMNHQFRILNPLVVKETALDILQFMPPRWRWLVRDKNVPTIGAIAVILATHLCDEVSVAGFGYDLKYPDRALHYFENMCMKTMNKRSSHNITKESELLQTLVKKGIIKDLSGGLLCEFCPSDQTKELNGV